VNANHAFAELLTNRGYRSRDPIYSLLFLTFDSLPWVRLTSRGIWDVRARQVLAPAQPLAAGAP
jgi:adenine deaminase